MDKIKNRSGQAITEYILLLAILISAYTGFIKVLTESGVIDGMKKPLEKQFKYLYQYGHPDARGPDDGGPKNIPQQNDDDFRIFINPSTSP